LTFKLVDEEFTFAEEFTNFEESSLKLLIILLLLKQNNIKNKIRLVINYQ